MCLGIPGEIVAIEQPAEEGALLQGVVSFGGVRKRVCLAFVPQAKVGDHAIVHAGFALDLIDEERAREIFATLAELDQSLDAEQPRQTAVTDVGQGGLLCEIPG
ncbi:MAG: HypC/HybG/HupF family hydrogenase formation chaperone [Isosphaeraceae bacterium]|jgi:hydrogenase expression/formation protein HypC